MKEFPPQDTRTQFSERLKTALDDRSIPASPTLLRNHFNEHYEGKPISTQTASNWLSGVSIPNQDELQVLADWLSVDIHWLRFGDESKDENPMTLSGDQIQVAIGFASLTPPHQKIILDLISSLLPKKLLKKWYETLSLSLETPTHFPH